MSTTVRVYFTQSVAVLVLANLVTIAFAEWQGWDLLNVLWIYWAQSLIMTFFTWRRILNLKQFSVEGFEDFIVEVEQSKPTGDIHKMLAGTFLAVYGVSHLIFLVFLINANEASRGMRDIGFAVCILVFVVNHAFSYFHNRQEDMNRTPELNTIFMFPVIRIAPMILTLIFASMVASGGSLLQVLVLKTLADVIMHIVLHSDLKAIT